MINYYDNGNNNISVGGGEQGGGGTVPPPPKKKRIWTAKKFWQNAGRIRAKVEVKDKRND